jgi:hypothetical protein
MTNGYLSDYCDGELLRESTLFQEDPSALQIQLYYDEVEICNPLGSKAKKHKLGTQLHLTSLCIHKTKDTFLCMSQAKQFRHQ